MAKASCVGLVLETHHEIVRVAHDDYVAARVLVQASTPKSSLLLDLRNTPICYQGAQIRDILVTAATAFAAVRAESTRARVCIHTGHWGTGAFGGERVLMAAAQMLSARSAGIDEIRYHSLDDDGVRAFEQGNRIADGFAAGSSLDAVVSPLESRGFSWGTSDGN